MTSRSLCLGKEAGILRVSLVTVLGLVVLRPCRAAAPLRHVVGVKGAQIDTRPL